ncbi:MAG: protein kinase [Actinomycetota bacterium]
MSNAHAGVPGLTDATEIGRGGFGVVYKASESDLGRDVAVKVLTGQLDDQSKVRFERERRSMGTLSGHPNIVTIFRSGTTDQGSLYLVMEYLPGGSLADQLQREGPLTVEEVLRTGVELAGALETAHRAGVLHRDIKPGNVMTDSLGRAKLGDFGIARMDGAPETKSAVVTASVAHAPPEVIAGTKPDERSDVYSLGSTLFELASGAPAFSRPTDESMIPMFARIAGDPPPDLRQRGIPHGVAVVLEQAMAKAPEHRFQTAAQLGKALNDAQRTLGFVETRLWLEGESDRDTPARPATQIVDPPPSQGWAPPLPPSPGQSAPPPAQQNPPSAQQSPAPPPAAYPPAAQPPPPGQAPSPPATGHPAPPNLAPPNPSQPNPAPPGQAPAGPGATPQQTPSQPAAGYPQSTQPGAPPPQPGTVSPGTVSPGAPQQVPPPNQFAGGPPGGYSTQGPGVGQQPQPEPRKSSTGLVVASVIGALVLVVGIAAVLARGSDDTPDPDAFVDIAGTAPDSTADSTASTDVTTTTTEATTTSTASTLPPSPPRAAYLADLPEITAEATPYTGYRTVTDAQSAFTLRVPIDWIDVLATDGQVLVSPDNSAVLDETEGAEAVSGIVVSGTQGVGVWDADVFLDELIAGTEEPCNPVKREPYVDGPFDGLIYAELCDGGVLVVSVIVASADRGAVILVGMQMTDERDMAAFEEALASFTLFDQTALPAP